MADKTQYDKQPSQIIIISPQDKSTFEKIKETLQGTLQSAKDTFSHLTTGETMQQGDGGDGRFKVSVKQKKPQQQKQQQQQTKQQAKGEGEEEEDWTSTPESESPVQRRKVYSRPKPPGRLSQKYQKKKGAGEWREKEKPVKQQQRQQQQQQPRVSRMESEEEEYAEGEGEYEQLEEERYDAGEYEEEEREQRPATKKQQLRDFEKKLKQLGQLQRDSVSSGKRQQENEMVVLNVGGRKFRTTKKTLTKYKNSFFTQMLEDDSMQDEKGTYFIDRPYSPFKLILAWLQTGELHVPKEEHKRELLRRELIFYGLEEQTEEYFSPVKKRESSITGMKGFEQIKEWLLYGKKWTLIYTGSRDGFSAKDFHEHCDNKGATLTIVKTTKGNIFGGYCSTSWSSDERPVSDSSACLFSLKGPLGVKLFKIVNNSHNSVIHDPELLPTFGASPDLCISSDCNRNKNSYCHASGTFYLGGYLDGSSRFCVEELEVFRVENK